MIIYWSYSGIIYTYINFKHFLIIWGLQWNAVGLLSSNVAKFTSFDFFSYTVMLSVNNDISISSFIVFIPFISYSFYSFYILLLYFCLPPLAECWVVMPRLDRLASFPVSGRMFSVFHYYDLWCLQEISIDNFYQMQSVPFYFWCHKNYILI